MHRARRAACVWLVLTSTVCAADDESIFEKEVRPILVERCYRCHGGESTKGGLRVDSRDALLKGGESGPALVPKDPEKSLLIHAIRRKEDLSAMPPDQPLPTASVEVLQRWIASGAMWPAPKMDRPFVAKRHWAFAPVTAADIRLDPRGAGDAENAIDLFLEVPVQARGLVKTKRVDDRSWLRRASYDLTGLPPTYADVADFENDPRPDADARWIDRLLASPAYGERWGRHWLDLARYADTAGENSDRPLAEAWRYRNWVIEAFNRNKPYPRFLQEQLAGDLLADQQDDDAYAEGVIATGYLAIARRFDHDIDKFMHLTFEDVLDTMGQSVLGLTIGCARCHAHKYDPISSEDYYSLYGILASTRFPFTGCEPKPLPKDLVPLVPPAKFSERMNPFQDRLKTLEQAVQETTTRRDSLETTWKEWLTAAPASPLGEGEVPDASLDPTSVTTVASPPCSVSPGDLLLVTVGPRGNHGADSTAISIMIDRLDASPQTTDLAHDVLDRFTLSNPLPASEDQGAWGFFDARDGLRLLNDRIHPLDGHEGLAAWKRGDLPSVFANISAAAVAAWTKLAPRSLFVHPAADGPVAIGWLSHETARVRVRVQLQDAHPGGDGVSWKLTHVRADVSAQLKELAESAAAVTTAVAERDSWQANSPLNDVALAVTEGTPTDVPIQERGDPEKKGSVVPRRWLTLFGGEEVHEGSGRLDLARWLTDEKNPLTFRVIVNRIWQHHFGIALVATPNDFGTRGLPPTHPELLDWLADEFRSSGGDLKRLHRDMMTSAAYRRSSFCDDPIYDASRLQDPKGQTYWRFQRRRLSAEELRDSILLAAGELEPTIAGAHPFPPPETWRYTQHTPFAESYDHRRRSVYLMVKRNQRDRFLGLFDGADPNASTPTRGQTLSPTQSLYFMNDEQFHRAARSLAERLCQSRSADLTQEIHRIVYQRAADNEEKAMIDAFRNEAPDGSEEDHWAAVARLLLSTNEFLYVD